VYGANIQNSVIIGLQDIMIHFSSSQNADICNSYPNFIHFPSPLYDNRTMPFILDIKLDHRDCVGTSAS
jgi:hypothetical protein